MTVVPRRPAALKGIAASQDRSALAQTAPPPKWTVVLRRPAAQRETAASQGSSANVKNALHQKVLIAVKNELFI